MPANILLAVKIGVFLCCVYICHFYSKHCNVLYAKVQLVLFLLPYRFQ